MKQLLIERPIIFTPTIQNIVEHVMGKDNGNIMLKNVLLTTVEKENGNGRVYPKPLWEREINKFAEKIRQKTTETVGELDHPATAIINLRNGSHAIREVWWDGDQVRCNIEVFCDPGPKGNESGRILGSYLRNGLAVGFSTRGEGSLQQIGEVMEVQSDFQFITLDSVSNPSNAGSWSRLNESQGNNKINPYNRVNNIITEILCAKGSCPIW